MSEKKERTPRKGKWNYFTNITEQSGLFGIPEETETTYRWRQVGGKKTGYEEFQRQVKVEFDPDTTITDLIEILTEFDSKYEDTVTSKETESYPYESETYTVFCMIGWEPVSTEEAKAAWETYEARFNAREAGQKLMRRQQAERELERIKNEFPELIN